MIIVSHIAFFLFITFFNGRIFLKLSYRNNLEFNIYETVFFGLIITGFFAQIINFFLPLNDKIIYFNLLIISFYILTKYKSFNIHLTIKDIFIFIFLIFFIFILIYGSSFSDDLNHYHNGYITNTDNFNYIFGLNFLHHHYGYSSIWLILHSYLNFDNNILQDIHVLNGIILISVLGTLITEFFDHNKKKNNFLIVLIIFFIFFIFLKYTRIKEFGIDRPGFLIFIFITYYFFKYYLSNIYYKNQHYKNILILSLFLFSIKLIYIPFLFLSLIFVLKKNLRPILFSKFSYFYIFLITSYFFKNIIISGCIIYPLDLTCLEFIPWNSSEISKIISFNTEVMNKSYYEYSGNLSKTEYIKNFNWKHTWLLRNINELSEYFATILVCIFFTLMIIKKNSIIQFKEKKIIYILYILLILSLVISLKTPVIRMFHHIFLIIGIIFLFYRFRNYEVSIKKYYFITFFVLFLSFNFSKNFLRIYQGNFINNPYQHIYERGWYQVPKLMKLGKFEYYKGWIDAAPIGNENLDKYNHKKIKFFHIISK